MADRLAHFAMMSVLVIDDDEANVALLRSLLGHEGLHRITSETDPRRVAALLPSINPDLVLLDLHMPHMDGHVVLEQIVQFAAGSYLPVLVLTADVSSEARDRALANGARDYLVKPIDIVETALRVANLLQTRELYVTLRRSAAAGRERPEFGLRARARIQAVIDERAITPVFQPIVDVRSMVATGYEALARFTDPHERGPAGWFSDAANVGLGVDLEWLAAEVATPFLDSAPPDTFLAVNMSPPTVMHLRDHELCRPALWPRLVIELTEHVPIEDYSSLHDSLRAMRAAGTLLAADDLGAGYAGFRHLVALEPDIIKLDISLVSSLVQVRGARALAAALVAFALDVGATVIAEGVEHQAELDVLADIGVPLAQGYLLGRPAPTAAPI